MMCVSVCVRTLYIKWTFVAISSTLLNKQLVKIDKTIKKKFIPTNLWKHKNILFHPLHLSLSLSQPHLLLRFLFSSHIDNYGKYVCVVQRCRGRARCVILNERHAAIKRLFYAHKTFIYIAFNLWHFLINAQIKLNRKMKKKQQMSSFTAIACHSPYSLYTSNNKLYEKEMEIILAETIWQVQHINNN